MIFCVEDDNNIRDLLVYTLETTGFHARGLEDSQELWKALAEEEPELILLDIMLPGEDGYSILEKLKKSSGTRDIPIIMVTAKEAEFDNRTHKTGQKICGGHDNDHVAEKRNNKGLGTFSKAFPGTGGGDGYCGNQEAGADALQCSGTCGNGFRGSCEKSHKLSGCQETDNGSKEHDHTAGLQGQPEDFFHTLHFTGTEVITDQRAHSLDDSVGREIQEGLQFIINAKDHHIAV